MGFKEVLLIKNLSNQTHVKKKKKKKKDLDAYLVHFCKSKGLGQLQLWFNYWFSFTLAYSRISH